MFLGSEVLTDNSLRIVLTDDFNSVFLGNVNVEKTNVESS